MRPQQNTFEGTTNGKIRGAHLYMAYLNSRAGMDPALAMRINAVFNQVLQAPAVRTAITETQSADISGGTPQQFDAFIKEELKRWPEVVRAAGIKPQ